MNILVDENALWLARDENSRHLTEIGIQIAAIGRERCPPLGCHDPEIAKWCHTNGHAILTYDFDDFVSFKEVLVILGLVQHGVFRNRPDIIAMCLKNCIATSGTNAKLPAGLYMLGSYNW